MAPFDSSCWHSIELWPCLYRFRVKARYRIGRKSWFFIPNCTRRCR